ncbi:MAG: thiamine biosynthesis protein ThiS [Desulfobacteraceae bacterium]|nr:MAG: thiamine biosynthesis protein ThiS [Desulfobacteraceae bacterium]
MEKELEIKVNGSVERIPAGRTLSWLIAFFDENDANLIVERNGAFIYPQQYGAVVLQEGDTVEFINPDFGG